MSTLQKSSYLAPACPHRRGRDWMPFQHLTVAVTWFWCLTCPSCPAKYGHRVPLPPVLLWLRSDWTMPTIELSTHVFNWQLESINAESSSYDNSTINHIHIHDWKYIFGLIEDGNVVGLCHSPKLSWKGPSELLMFTNWLISPSCFPPVVHEWYLPWKVVISMIWKNELPCLTSGNNCYSSGLQLRSLVCLNVTCGADSVLHHGDGVIR